MDGGTRLVWIVWPDRQQVEVWRAGRGVVPAFTYPIAGIFADPLA